eukprot:TRINITY_DN13082_c0_g1_i1.p1 TRINITY_DN13082_c0_g1~~TRINITY_DN13082_c0_g1_i1.p1  ORF type:complete len:253 (+),score=16.71 TRINITY_DN13082_c0_g1_i1:58-816(+)
MESLEDLPDSVFGSASATQGGSEAAKKVPLDLVESEDSPFSEFKISSLAPLLEKQKHHCPNCGKPKTMFCPRCMLPVLDSPNIKLPIHVHIIKHESEKITKATSIHAKVLAPEDVSVHSNLEIPEFDPETTVLLFPSEDAQSLDELDFDKVANVVFIESTWQTCGGILQNPSVEGIPRVKIPNRETLFWRHQNFGPSFLSTIEAIFYFVQDFIRSKTGAYTGEVDDLLYFFFVPVSFNSERIQTKRTIVQAH